MDRKAWIVLLICGVLIALNLHYQGKNAEILRKKQEAERAEKAQTPAPSPTESSSEEEPGRLVVEPPPAPKEKVVEINLKTESVGFELSTLTGSLEHAEQFHHKSVYDPEQRVRVNDFAEHGIGTLTDLEGNIIDQRYVVKEATDNRIVFLGKTSNGLVVSKTWSRVEGEGSDYRLQLEVKISNPGETSVDLGKLGLVTGTAAPLFEEETPNYLNFFWEEDNSFSSKSVGYFKGGFFSSAKTHFFEPKEMIGFAGVENQFFATIVTPQKPYSGIVRAEPKDVTLPPSRGGTQTRQVTSVLSLEGSTLGSGEARTLVYDVFTGPKRNSLLRSLGEGRGEVMNYGFFSWISNPLNWTLNKLAALFGGTSNPWAWGWAIVALTILIRTLIWPLHAKSTRTMKRMSKLQPKMKELKEKYPDDPNKLNQETMKLYRDFGVNPVGGCLPMLAQIPIFFGFFTMLRSAVELRNERFAWVDDLSQPDTLITFDLPFSIPFLGDSLPLNVLPILMAVTMVIQMQITPKTGDKMQQRIFMLMPIIFFFFCYNFASALALYWTTQNIFSIGQTWLMQKMPEPELKASKKAKSGKKSMLERLQERAEEAQRLKNQSTRGPKGKGPGGKGPSGSTPSKPKKPRGPRTGG